MVSRENIALCTVLGLGRLVLLDDFSFTIPFLVQWSNHQRAFVYASKRTEQRQQPEHFVRKVPTPSLSSFVPMVVIFFLICITLPPPARVKHPLFMRIHFDLRRRTVANGESKTPRDMVAAVCAALSHEMCRK